MPPPENRFKNKYYPVEWGSEFFQTISSMLIIDPKFVIIMIELIKNTISNKLQEIGKSIEKNIKMSMRNSKDSQIIMHAPQSLDYHAIIAR